MFTKRALQAVARRHYHAPELQHLATGKPVTGLLSVSGVEKAWFERTTYHTEQLNKHYPTSIQEQPLDQLMNAFQGTAAADKKLVLQHATLVHNIKFAFSSLFPNKLGEPAAAPKSDLLRTFSPEFINTPPEALQAHITRSFGSLLEFRTLLLNSAHAIEGDGFTWLVARQTRGGKFDKLFVVNSYNAGSISGEYTPLLCLDASPKTWLTDYGVYGKTAYLERCWESVDWNLVADRLPAFQETYSLGDHL